MENRYEKIIGFDFDDVVFNFMESLNEMYNEKYKTNHQMELYTTYDLHDVWNCAPVDVWDLIADFYSSEKHLNTLPIKGAIETLKTLKGDNKFVVITARPETVEAETLLWLDTHIPGLFDEVHFTNHYGTSGIKRGKGEVCKELGVELYIEDALHNAEDVASAGIPVLLFNTPWNQKELPPLITRVHSWEEIAKKIEEL